MTPKNIHICSDQIVDPYN